MSECLPCSSQTHADLGVDLLSEVGGLLDLPPGVDDYCNGCFRGGCLPKSTHTCPTAALLSGYKWALAERRASEYRFTTETSAPGNMYTMVDSEVYGALDRL